MRQSLRMKQLQLRHILSLQVYAHYFAEVRFGENWKVLLNAAKYCKELHIHLNEEHKSATDAEHV